MSSKNQPIANVLTNVITGFLGVGKTTAILNLLKQRPSNEYWSILVNEYGEMGIDGHLLEDDDRSVTIKQVPGGCICCAAGLPLQVAVNQLLKQTHPDRLIIEPSGMGHPRRIMKSLTDTNYAGVLDMRACLCLLDPRKLSDERYLQSELFIDQVEVADIVVANKTDLASLQDKDNFTQFVLNLSTRKTTQWIERGQLDITWLMNESSAFNKPPQFNQNTEYKNNTLEVSFNKCTVDFRLNIQFKINEVEIYIRSLDAERIKGILNTDKGFISVNYADGQLQTHFTNNKSINRLEIISLNKFSEDEISLDLMKMTN